jgi:hypothetical protein
MVAAKNKSRRLIFAVAPPAAQCGRTDGRTDEVFWYNLPTTAISTALATMSVSLSRPSYLVLASSSLVVVTWRLLQWRARKRAKKTVERVKKMVKEGAPLVSKAKKQKK